MGLSNRTPYPSQRGPLILRSRSRSRDSIAFSRSRGPLSPQPGFPENPQAQAKGRHRGEGQGFSAQIFPCPPQALLAKSGLEGFFGQKCLERAQGKTWAEKPLTRQMFSFGLGLGNFGGEPPPLTPENSQGQYPQIQPSPQAPPLERVVWPKAWPPPMFSFGLGLGKPRELPPNGFFLGIWALRPENLHVWAFVFFFLVRLCTKKLSQILCPNVSQCVPTCPLQS